MTQIATLTRSVEGVETDSGVSSVTVGITRDSDSAVVLASGTATTHTSGTGVWTYDYSALSLDSSLSYTLTWTINLTAGGAETVTESIAAADSSRTLRGYRLDLGKTGKLGPYQLITTDSAGTTATLVCGALADSDMQQSAYDGVYAYVASGALAGQQRRIAKSGYTAATGTLQFSRVFASAPASGIDVELWHRLPVIPQDGAQGINAHINNALKACWLIDRLELTGVANRQFYSLASYPWLQRQDQLGQIYIESSDSNANPLPHPGGCWLRFDGESPMLEVRVPFNTGDTFWIDVIRPAHTWIKSGGAWGASSVGLADDDDEAVVEPYIVREVALAYALKEIAALANPLERGEWAALARDQAEKAALVKLRGLPKLDDVKTQSTGFADWGKGLFSTRGLW